MNTPIVLGIDPGKTGALAALDAATGHLIWIEDMPDPIDGALIADLLTNEIVAAAAVESQVGRPGQSSSAMFKFGTGYGVILGTLGALRIGYELVTPAKWKGGQGLSKDKNASRALAVRRWPDHAPLFARVKDDGRAEAALIAHHQWAKRTGAA